MNIAANIPAAPSSAARNGHALNKPQVHDDVPQALSALVGALTTIDDPGELVEALNEVRSALHELSPLKHHPVDFVRWVPAVAVHGGFLSIAGDRVSILAHRAQLGSEVDPPAVREALDSADEAGAQPAGDEGSADVRYLRAQLRAAGDRA